MVRRFLPLVGMLLLGADWPQFRGPNASGVADGTNPPVTWSLEEGLRWKVALPGKGLGNPVAVGNNVFVTSCSGPKQERLQVLAFDLATGEKLWEREVFATGSTMCHRETNMAAPSPAADAKAVYALFACGDLTAFDHDGNLLWYRSLVGDYPTIVNNLGMAASPILHKDVLIVPLDNPGEDSLLVGINTTDGTNRWTAPRPRGTNWATPVLLTRDGQTVVYIQSGKDRSAYDPLTGSLQWKQDQGASTSPSPVTEAGQVVTFTDGLTLLKPASDGGPPSKVWSAAKMTSRYSTPLVYRDRVYTINRAGVLSATDLNTGKEVWKDAPRLKGFYWSSPVAADGRLYATNADGQTIVVELGDTPKILATNSLGENVVVQASPILADGAVLIRAHEHLYCLGTKPAK